MGKVILYIDVYSLEFFRIFTRNMRKSMNPLPGISLASRTVPSRAIAMHPLTGITMTAPVNA
jgi:hypothetical protein